MNEIAAKYGFSWITLWDHSGNADLRALRENPSVLMQGDRVFIPDKRQKEEACQSTLLHRFQLNGVPARLNFKLLDYAGKPRAGVSYTLNVDGATFNGTTEDDGLVSHIVPPNAQKANLTVTFASGRQQEYNFQLAYLNPADYVSGIQARLKNLGDYKGEINGNMDDASRDAIRRFQERSGLEATGQANAATKNALLQLHGS